MISKLKLEG